jgi:hypothetical protein
MSEKMSEKMIVNEAKFNCVKCNYKCRYESNYKLHLNTAKHKMLTDADRTVYQHDSYNCECGKKYKHRQSFYRHKTSCASNNLENIIVAQDNVENLDKSKDKETLILSLITQNKELMNLLQVQSTTLQKQSTTMQEQSTTMQEQTKTIQEMIPKMGNNNNNTTNNNKFNLQVFLNEDCKDAINFSDFIENINVTVEDLENQAQLGYVGGISKLFLENMKELGVNKRPIHCTDKKRNTLYIKENDKWDKDGSQEQLLYGIKVLTGRANQTLCDMKEDNPVEYSDIDSAFSNKCEDIQRNLLPVFPRETTFGKVIDSISNGSIVDREP